MFNFVLKIIAFSILSACSESGNKETAAALTGEIVSELKGKLTSTGGTVGDFAGWILVLTDLESGFSKIATIEQNGSYKFENVKKTAFYSLVLLKANYQFHSALSLLVTGQEGKLSQSFSLISSNLPDLVLDTGRVLTFSDLGGVTIQSNFVLDSNKNSLPDALEDITKVVKAEGNGLGKTWDIDADGMLNWFDPDDDGDETLDAFDIDADGDGEVDSTDTDGNHFFASPISYFSSQVSLIEGEMYITFMLKVASADGVNGVEIVGANTVFNDAQTVKVNDVGGEDTTGLWKRTLVDTGVSYDGNYKDGIFGVKLKLKASSTVGDLTTVFAKVDTEDGVYNVPFSYPSIALSNVTSTSASGVITKTSQPFGDGNLDYIWTVTVFDEAGTLVHRSSEISGSVSTYTPKTSDLRGFSHTYELKFESTAKIVGLPMYVVRTSRVDLVE